MENSEIEGYTKEMTVFYFKMSSNVVYTKKPFDKYPKEETISVQELEQMNVLDVNRYKKAELKQKIGNFIHTFDYPKLKKRIKKLKINAIETQVVFPYVYEISEEYAKAFKEYFVNKMRYKKRKRVSFRSIGNQHIQYLA